jgi:beta-N-acetylhexosaminidase
LISQKIIFGFSGTTLTEEAKLFIEKTHPAGFIFFDDNCDSLTQITDLLHELQEFYVSTHGHTAILSIDHESTAVQRLPSPITHFPHAISLGKIMSPQLATLMGRTMGQELKKCGFNLNFAPVCDVLTSHTPDYLKHRCFSDDSEKVASLTESFIIAMQAEGVKACAKHFPGLGSAAQDPHKKQTQTSQSIKTFRDQDWKIYKRAISAGVATVMTTHVLCSDLDKEHIATYSEMIIHTHLKKELGFKGLIISDDLKMGAILESPKEAIHKAIQSGHDLVIHSERGFTQNEHLIQSLKR